MHKCPCCSGKSYAECCQPYHESKAPETALLLMRSRYSAYALALAPYIIATTHPDHPDFKKNRAEWTKEILEFSKTTQFKKLEIVESEEKFVTFRAYLEQGGEPFTLTEKSRFEKINNKWLYIDGVIYI